MGMLSASSLLLMESMLKEKRQSSTQLQRIRKLSAGEEDGKIIKKERHSCYYPTAQAILWNVVAAATRHAANVLAYLNDPGDVDGPTNLPSRLKSDLRLAQPCEE